jgi:hypothetical protein
MTIDINTQDFREFLVRAKRNTFASGRTPIESIDGSKLFSYEEGILSYTDNFWGNLLFSGHEIVRENGKAIWGMNYHGRVEVPELNEAISDLLRRSLSQAPLEFPFRGPINFQIVGDGLSYSNSLLEHSIENFAGIERITSFDRPGLVYSSNYHGGLIL